MTFERTTSNQSGDIHIWWGDNNPRPLCGAAGDPMGEISLTDDKSCPEPLCEACAAEYARRTT